MQKLWGFRICCLQIYCGDSPESPAHRSSGPTRSLRSAVAPAVSTLLWSAELLRPEVPLGKFPARVWGPESPPHSSASVSLLVPASGLGSGVSGPRSIRLGLPVVPPPGVTGTSPGYRCRWSRFTAVPVHIPGGSTAAPAGSSAVQFSAHNG